MDRLKPVLLQTQSRSEDRLKPVLLEMQSRSEKMAAQEFLTRGAEETTAIGRELAMQLHPPLLVLLRGDLGSGKTTLTKGIISGLGAAREEDITSPTFNLIHEFQIPVPADAPPPQGKSASKVYHVDLYRVESFHDLESLGLEDAFSENAIVIIEWPEHFTFRTNWPTIEIRLEHTGGDSRRIRMGKISRLA